MVQSTVFNWLVGLTVTLIVVTVTVGTFSIIGFVADDHQERYITTVHSSIDEPTSYAGVKLDFAYHYKKDENRVRVAISLSDGYPYSAATDLSDTPTVNANNVLPTWACHANPLSSDDTASFMAQVSDTTISGWIANSRLINTPDGNGYWQLNWVDDSFFEEELYLGMSECSKNYDDDAEMCLADFLLTMEFRLLSPIDITAWGAKYDAAPR